MHVSYARLMPTLSGTLGNPRVYSYISTQTWEIPTQFDVLYRVTYTVQSGQPSWLVLSQELGFHGTNSIYQFTNPNSAITDTRALVIPNNCVPNETLTALTVG
ncbi:hypothetical protein Btru_042375 [Bulinus truncatus]|nr:hypothetical protein Btru_042375 [Bulinus truncatus]